VRARAAATLVTGPRTRLTALRDKRRDAHRTTSPSIQGRDGPRTSRASKRQCNHRANHTAARRNAASRNSRDASEVDALRRRSVARF
jgi:hypothetical protein